MCIIHPQYWVCLDFILCFWVHFISLKASMFLLPVSITVIQSFILIGLFFLVSRICGPAEYADQRISVNYRSMSSLVFLLIKHFFHFIYWIEMTLISPWNEGDMRGWCFSDGPTTREERVRFVREGHGKVSVYDPNYHLCFGACCNHGCILPSQSTAPHTCMSTHI